MYGRITQIVGLLIGLALAAGAIWSVFFIDWSRERPKPESVIRPVRTFVVGEGPTRIRTFPARVRATNEVTLSFQVSGTLAQLPVIRGQRVEEGELLAQLDLRDFESRLLGARANFERLTDELAAVTRAFELQAANQIEVARHRAALDQARADRDIFAKALEDATLTAPFDGVVADLFVDNFEKVSVGTRILRLQGSKPVRVEVNVDAARVAHARTYDDAVRHTVRFDFLPEREYGATLVEFTTEADRSTQTFRAIFEIEPPEDVIVLPGMTATLIERRLDEAPSDASEVSVPLFAVVRDGVGAPSVWVLGETDAQGTAQVRRREVEVGSMYGDTITVTRGLARNDRIVVAGVRELSEGQRVRVAAPQPAGGPNRDSSRGDSP